MKLVPRKSVNLGEQRRNNLQFERQRAAALREMYPAVGRLHVVLVFADGSPHTPSPQSHTFFPSARAFFRFACPCAECDGDFDLRAPVGALLTNVLESARPVVRNAKGRVSCEGVRLRDRAGSRPCAMTLEYQLAASPNRPA